MKSAVIMLAKYTKCNNLKQQTIFYNCNRNHKNVFLKRFLVVQNLKIAESYTFENMNIWEYEHATLRIWEYEHATFKVSSTFHSNISAGYNLYRYFENLNIC